MNKNKLFLLCMAVIMALAFTAAVSAQWDGYYCTSGNCGINYYNYNCGYNTTGYYCTGNYTQPYQASFVKDVTYADGAYVAPGQAFSKTWRIRNTGTYTWTTKMALVFVGGDQMGASPCVYLPYNVSPGYYVDITVPMIAPEIPTNAMGEWKLRAPDGTIFGVGCNGSTSVWVSINTMNVNSSCACYSPTGCTTPCVISAASNTVSRPGRNPYCNNKIRSVKDVTYPDGTVVAPGATFRKSWSMKNGGTCVWDENYVLAFVGGDNMGGDQIVPVTTRTYPNAKYSMPRPATKVYPGDYVTISIDLKAPETPGVYEGYYRLRDNYGYEFGFGSYADEAFWVRIVVDDGSKSAEPDSPDTITKDVAEAEVEAVELAGEKVVVPEDTVETKCGEQTISMRPTDTGYEVFWSAVNVGTKTWENYTLVNSDANPAVFLDGTTIAIPKTAPGETAEVSFNISLDETNVNGDPYWMEFYMNSGEEGFCEFYFEAPAK